MPLKPYILVVEDDRFLARAYQAKLGMENIEADVAYDGNEALTKLKERIPNLILLDLMLPKKSGFEVLEEIRQNPQLKDIPVFVLSNLGQEEDIHRVQALGVSEYLVKADTTLEAVIKKIKDQVSP